MRPSDRRGRIPIIAITGTNGKTTTTRLTQHLVKQAGFTVGFTTTEGIYIGDSLIEEGDCTGPVSAQKVLPDSSVNFAVLECARGGMLRSGLAFDQCDVGIVTNVAADHLGLRDINSVEDMARVKAIVPERVGRGGYAVLNADNAHTHHRHAFSGSGTLPAFSLRRCQPPNPHRYWAWKKTRASSSGKATNSKRLARAWSPSSTAAA